MTDRCHICDRVPATEHDYATIKPGDGDWLCWGDSQCRSGAVDWRERVAGLTDQLAAAVKAAEERAGKLSAYECPACEGHGLGPMRGDGVGGAYDPPCDECDGSGLVPRAKIDTLRADVERLTRELADANHWRERWAKEHMAAAAQSQDNWLRAQTAERERDAARAELATGREKWIRAGFAIAQEHAEVSEHDGWHRTDPCIWWQAAEEKLEATLAATPGAETGPERPPDGSRWKSPAGPIWTWDNGGRWAEGGGFVANDHRTIAQLTARGWERLDAPPPAAPAPAEPACSWCDDDAEWCPRCKAGDV